MEETDEAVNTTGASQEEVNTTGASQEEEKRQLDVATSEASSLASSPDVPGDESSASSVNDMSLGDHNRAEAEEPVRLELATSLDSHVHVNINPGGNVPSSNDEDIDGLAKAVSKLAVQDAGSQSEIVKDIAVVNPEIGLQRKPGIYIPPHARIAYKDHMDGNEVKVDVPTKPDGTEICNIGPTDPVIPEKNDISNAHNQDTVVRDDSETPVKEHNSMTSEGNLTEGSNFENSSLDSTANSGQKPHSRKLNVDEIESSSSEDSATNLQPSLRQEPQKKRINLQHQFVREIVKIQHDRDQYERQCQAAQQLAEITLHKQMPEKTSRVEQLEEEELSTLNIKKTGHEVTSKLQFSKKRNVHKQRQQTRDSGSWQTGKLASNQYENQASSPPLETNSIGNESAFVDNVPYFVDPHVSTLLSRKGRNSRRPMHGHGYAADDHPKEIQSQVDQSSHDDTDNVGLKITFDSQRQERHIEYAKSTMVITFDTAKQERRIERSSVPVAEKHGRKSEEDNVSSSYMSNFDGEKFPMAKPRKDTEVSRSFEFKANKPLQDANEQQNNFLNSRKDRRAPYAKRSGRDFRVGKEASNSNRLLRGSSDAESLKGVALASGRYTEPCPSRAASATSSQQQWNLQHEVKQQSTEDLKASQGGNENVANRFDKTRKWGDVVEDSDDDLETVSETTAKFPSPSRTDSQSARLDARSKQRDRFKLSARKASLNQSRDYEQESSMDNSKQNEWGYNHQHAVPSRQPEGSSEKVNGIPEGSSEKVHGIPDNAPRRSVWERLGPRMNEDIPQLGTLHANSTSSAFDVERKNQLKIEEPLKDPKSVEVVVQAYKDASQKRGRLELYVPRRGSSIHE